MARESSARWTQRPRRPSRGAKLVHEGPVLLGAALIVIYGMKDFIIVSGADPAIPKRRVLARASQRLNLDEEVPVSV